MSETPLNTLVDIVIGHRSTIKKILPDMSDVEKSKEFIRRSDPPLEKKEIEGIATDLVVNEFINSPDKTFKFMSTICDLFYETIEMYSNKMNLKPSNKDVLGDVYFIYKGGNVMRLLMHEFKKNVSSKGAKLIESSFAKSFKKSDSDFSILINPELPNFDEVYSDMIHISYLLQLIIRKLFASEFQSSGNSVFGFLEYNEAKKESILKETFDKMNSSFAVTDSSNSLYYQKSFVKVAIASKQYPSSTGDSTIDSTILDSSRPDFLVTYPDETKQTIITYFIDPNKKSNFYVSVNKALEFSNGTPEKPLKFKFALVRTKLNCTAMLKDNRTSQTELRNIGGEVIDCTILHKESHNNTTKEEFDHTKDLMRKYTLAGPDNNQLVFYGYGLEGLTHDLELILFETVAKPWEDNKYAKRVNRLFFLYMVDLYAKSSDNRERIELISKYRVNVIEKLRNAFNSATTESFAEAIKIDSTFDSRYMISKSVKELQRIASISTGDNENFVKMMDVLDENTNVILGILQDTEEYVKSEGRYKNEAYTGEVESMAGGYIDLKKSRKPMFRIHSSLLEW